MTNSTPFTAELVSIQVGRPQLRGIPGATDPLDKPYTSGFTKAAVSGAIELDWLNLAGDGQADSENHGGRDKAVCAYAADHYAGWRARLNLAPEDFPPGAFGENWTIAGANEATICLGDIFDVGKARVQVSQPRQPCWKLGRQHRRKELPGWVIDNGQTGWYFRVLRPGQVVAGMALMLAERPQPDWTIARANDVMYRQKKDAVATAALAAVPELAISWRDALESRANLLRS